MALEDNMNKTFARFLVLATLTGLVSCNPVAGSKQLNLAKNNSGVFVPDVAIDNIGAQAGGKPLGGSAAISSEPQNIETASLQVGDLVYQSLVDELEVLRSANDINEEDQHELNKAVANARTSTVTEVFELSNEALKEIECYENACD
jgi:hypothetical protein